MKTLAIIERELEEMLTKRSSLIKNLESIENSLYNLETAYIEETQYGNIIRGYEGFLSARTPASRRQRATDSERIFTSSSVTYQRDTEMDFFNPTAALNEDQIGDADFMPEKPLKKKKRPNEGGSRLKKRIVYSDDDE